MSESQVLWLPHVSEYISSSIIHQTNDLNRGQIGSSQNIKYKDKSLGKHNFCTHLFCFSDLYIEICVEIVESFAISYSFPYYYRNLLK